MRTMKTLTLTACLLLLSVFMFSQQVAKTIPNLVSPEGLIGFLEFKPTDYGTQKHPLIIFLHGIGERGNGTSQINSVANNGIAYYCSKNASMRFTVAGQTSSFVVLSPQLSMGFGYWPSFYVYEMVKYAKANLQIDTNRIYVTGLSLGGGGVWGSITDSGNPTFDAGIAAAAPVCGTQQYDPAMFCSTIGTYHLPVWAFHSMDDGTVNVSSTQIAEAQSKTCGVTPASLFTYYQTGNHSGAWVNAYDTGHITRTTVVNGVPTSFTANPNLYEWFLSKTRATGNTAPVANAGSNINITLPTNNTTLNGSGSSDPDGTIATYAWSKTSGPASYTIASAGAATTALSNLVQGVYVFTLQVTDNAGATNTSTVTVTVNAAANQSPVANAGSNINITLPTNNTTLNGSGSSDPDGSIATYAWSKTSGPASYTIASAGAATTALSNLVQGVYVFTLQVTDNAGATNTSTVTVTVVAAPVANAGPSQTISSTSTVLTATASYSPNGSITSYNWQQVSGPAAVTIVNANSATPSVSNLVVGSTYAFQLTVTDVAGASGSAVTDVNVVSGALPVEFSYFKGQSNSTGNLLQWGTATEQNNDYFSIERSNDGAAFSSIGKVTGSGTSTAAHDYSFTDTKAVTGNYYYRLKQVDKDGKFDFSKVILVTGSSNAAAAQMYPNPVQSSLSIVLNNDIKGNGKISVYDLAGHNVRQDAVVKNDKTLNAVVNMNSLTPGLYIVEIQIGDTYKLSKSILKK